MIEHLKRTHWHQINSSNNIEVFSDYKNKVGAYFLGKSSSHNTGYLLKQVHGNHIVKADINQPLEADGSFTTTKEINLVIQTADCLPVLLYCPKSNFVMALHVGWKGLCAGIINSAYIILQEKPLTHNSFLVALGPCISANRFEVGPEVIESYFNLKSATSNAEKNIAILKGTNDRWHLDLALAATIELIALGFVPQKLHIYKHCTFDNTETWHSYRREAQNAGRNLATIILKD